VTDGTHKTPRYVSEGVPFVSNVDLNDGKINFETCKRITQEEHMQLSRRCNVEPRDILLSKVGTLGNVAMVPTGVEFSIFVQLALIKPVQEKMSSYFMYYLLQTQNMQWLIQNRASQSTMKYIGIGKIAELLIYVPKFKEQQEITDILYKLDNKLNIHKEKKAFLQDLFRSLLNKLMTGELRVEDLNPGTLDSSNPFSKDTNICHQT